MTRLKTPSNEPPLVLQLLSTARMGGAERSVANLLHHVDDTGCRLAVGLLEESGPLLHEFDGLNVPVHCWATRVGDLPSSVAKLHRVLSGFDVVHAYGMRASMLARAVGCLAGVPILVSWESVAADRPWWYFALEKAASPFAAHYVAKSQAGKAALMNRVGVSGDRITVVHNGVDAHMFRPAAPESRDGPFTITCVANLRPVKRHDRLLQAYAAARTTLRANGIDSRLWIVGDGQCRPALEQSSSQLHLRGDTTFWGHVQDVPAILAQTHVVMLTSDFEGLPVALLEGMAAGCTPVAPAVGGIPELIVDGECGILVRGGTEAYVRALERLGCDGAYCQRLGRAARDRVLNRFSVEAMARGLGSLYRSLVVRSPRRDRS